MASFTFSTLDDPVGKVTSAARSVNAAGQIVGFYLDSTGTSHGFLYSGATYTTLDDPSAKNTYPDCINDAGQSPAHM